MPASNESLQLSHSAISRVSACFHTMFVLWQLDSTKIIPTPAEYLHSQEFPALLNFLLEVQNGKIMQEIPCSVPSDLHHSISIS